MLSYGQQVAELRKIAQLEPPPSPRPASPRPLGARSGALRCLVCQKDGAAACAACGAVAYCGIAHEREDAPWHDAVCEPLRNAREDAALRAGATRAALAAPLLASTVPRAHERLSSWDTYLPPELTGAARRVAADLASRPMTVAWLIHRLRLVGQNLLRVHVIGSSGTELLALELYAELSAFFPEASFEVAFVGPQLPSMPLPPLPSVRFALHTGDYRRALWATLGAPHLVVGFDAGLLLYRSWQPTLFELLRGGVPFAVTSYRAWEARAEAQVLQGVGGRCLFGPVPNPFASLACRRSSTVANDVSFDNAHVSVWG